MARIKKWIYSWELYVNYDDEWEISSICHSHKEYKAKRKYEYQKQLYPIKWVECRKPNPEYKGV